ncbi:MAG TPA: hypothetical protein DCX07_01195 [Phycisphaerales bacterium]|nr:hypothetical protein [Phycisphaerales bacterium]
MGLGGPDLSGLGSTPCSFFGTVIMGDHRSTSTLPPVDPTALFPLTDDEWQHAVKHLSLTPQQTKIVKLILHGRRDKQIAKSLSLSEATVRTHLARLFNRIGVADRVELVLLVVACARRRRPSRVR